MANSILQRLFNFPRILESRLLNSSAARLAKMNDPLDHATGIEKRELLAIKAGNRDPFMLDTIIKRRDGTKDSPTMVPSAFSGRIVGCSCRGNRFVNWMWLEKDCPKRCECGHWFKLKEVEPF